MKIKTATIIRGNDYTATMKCEHCGHEQKDEHGYDDHNYHQNVIPKMKCDNCFLSRNDINSKE